jgi:membrane-bound metal-dependent hydrolase YbcI (DUF457 family)
MSEMALLPHIRTDEDDTLLYHQFVTHALHQLHSLSFHAFAELVCDLLRRMGYTDVALLGRTTLRQRTRYGGRDIMASARTGVTGARVTIQLKLYERPVSRRFVDEMAGVMLRIGSTQGILITTSTFAKPAVQAAGRNRLTAVRLVDGPALVSLLARHQLGIKQTARGRLFLDTRFFRQLRRRFTPSSSVSTSPVSRNAPLASFTYPPNSRLMMSRTHLMAGITTLWLLTPIPGAVTGQTMAPLAVVAALGSLLPDLDAATSRLSTLEIAGVRPFAPVAQRLHADFGHRGLMHSLASIPVIALAALLVVPWWGWPLSAALILGWMSHLACDACTRTGIPGTPLTTSRLHLLPPKWRLVTGSADEELVFAVLALAAFTLVLLQLHAQ